jgi:hypothetical protein
VENLYRVAYVDLPCKVHGLTAYYFEDGQTFYTVFVNARDSIERQHKTLQHELEHIRNDDLCTMLSVQDLEALRHNLI